MKKYLGVYVHIPFCASKCAYCDFFSRAGCDHLMPNYHAALLTHIEESAPQLSGYLIDTVYFGGGTPSYYGADKLIEIFNALKKHGNVLIESEVTVEVNPGSITYPDLSALKKAGFNRLSIGVQCADNATLKSLGRQHTFEDAAQIVSDARRAGFDNISLDLIYGLPSQSREDWAETLNRTIALRPEHFSCYGLKIEERTPLYAYRNSPFIPDDDAQADMYLYTVDALGRSGYRQYEISNFSFRGYESRHNLKYWQGKEYIGFGAAAHSYIGGLRFSNLPSIALYNEKVASGEPIIEQAETITPFEQAGEYLMLGLRTTAGISEAEYRAIYPCSFEKIEALLIFYAEQGWAVRNGDRWNFTPPGFLLSNTLISNILDAQTEQRVDKLTFLQDSSTINDPQVSLFSKKNNETSLFLGI